MKLPKIIDLFSGCGGLALGFEKAGFEITSGIELMPEAVETVSYNLEYRYGKEASHICADITQTESSVCRNSFGDEGCIVIGGPPCQAYSKAGRAKLRSLGADRVHTNDSRGFLFRDFLRFAMELDARAVVMENVVDAVNFGGMNIPEIVSTELENNGYDVRWTVLNAADYGVPQIRQRIILIALKKQEYRKIVFPRPTHMGTRPEDKVTYYDALSRYQDNPHFEMPVQESGLEPWVTVGDAFSDLPELMSGQSLRYRSLSINTSKKYRSEAKNSFQKCMRSWYGYETQFVTANVFRNNERDFRIFDQMKQGDNYTDASAIADRLFENEAQNLGLSSTDEEYQILKRKRVPVYSREKFNWKWKRLSCSRPSHTLVAHLSKDTYSHIHPFEPRGISVREAARLQSFPDDFYFSCSMGDAYKQIGNAVPPLMSYAIAREIRTVFEGDQL